MFKAFKHLFAKNYFILLVLAVVGMAIFGNVMQGEFIFDDDLLIVNNQHIRSLKNIPKFFTTSSTDGAGLSDSNFYRPLQTLAYTVIFAIFGLNPSVYHLLPVLLHIAGALLIFLLLTRLKLSRTASFLAALIFLVHPIQTEAVSYIAGVADPMGLFFVLAGLLVYLDVYSPKLGQRLSKLTATLALFILALLSKELTVTFFLLATLLTASQWSQYKKPEQHFRFYVLVSYTILAIVYLILKFFVFDFTNVLGLTQDINLYTSSLGIRIITFISVLWQYAKMFFWPANLYLERPYEAYATIFTPQGAFGIQAIILLVAAIIYALKRRRHLLFLSLLWIVVSFIPVSGIIPLNAIYLEHWLRTIVRNRDWADAVAFFENEIRNNPGTARSYNNFGMVLDKKGDHRRAIEQYKQAIAIRDDYPQTHHNFGNSLLAIGLYDQAIEQFLLALKINPNFPYSLVALRNIYFAANKTEVAEQFANFLKKLQNGENITFDEILHVVIPATQ